MTTPAFVALLNGENGNAFVQDITIYNNGYPILAWQVAAHSARKAAPVQTLLTLINNNLGQLSSTLPSPMMLTGCGYTPYYRK